MKNVISLMALALSFFVYGTLLPADAARIYVMSCDDTATDDAAINVLTAHGHTVTLGVQFWEFDGTQDLSNIDVIYMQASYNWNYGDMPEEGQNALLEWLTDPAHGLVTGEWIIWKYSVGELQILGEAFAVEQHNPYRSSEFATFTKATPNTILNAGLPDNFTFAVNDYAGTETHLTPKPGSITFYDSDYFVNEVPGAGLVGGLYSGKGKVLHFSTTNGPDQLANDDFARLLSNAMDWAASDSAVEGDVNGDGCVDDIDLLLVLFAFGSDDPDADLNNNGVVDDGDLLMVLFNFGNGC